MFQDGKFTLRLHLSHTLLPTLREVRSALQILETSLYQEIQFPIEKSPQKVLQYKCSLMLKKIQLIIQN